MPVNDDDNSIGNLFINNSIGNSFINNLFGNSFINDEILISDLCNSENTNLEPIPVEHSEWVKSEKQQQQQQQDEVETSHRKIPCFAELLLQENKLCRENRRTSPLCN